MRPVHFEIHAASPDRAITFYRGVFGWEFTRWEGAFPYWLIRTGPGDVPGIDGGLVERLGPPPADGQPVNAWVNTIEVDDLDAALGRVQQHGGSLAVGKQQVPGVGFLAYVKDSEGNILGLLQPEM